MANLFDYSATPASNNSTPPDGAPEGMAPSEVNNTIRQMMANEAGAFNCYTAGGSADAQTVTMSPALAAYSTQVRIAFIPVANNTGACTLNVNGLGAVSIKMLDGSEPPADALNSSGVAVVQHNGANFVLLTPAKEVINGSFTGTLTGMTASTTGTINYSKSAGVVSLWAESAISGTSNASTMALTGLPNAVTPQNANIEVPCGSILDNGGSGTGVGSAYVKTDNTIDLRLLVLTSGAYMYFSNQFTSSGNKGLSVGWQITYLVN